MQTRTREAHCRYRWLALIAGMVTAVFVYALLNASASIQWEAIGVVRIGKTVGANWLDTNGSGEVGTANTMLGVFLLPVSHTIELMRHPSFKDKVLGQGGSDGSPVADESYRVRELVSENIEIRVRAPTRKRAQELIYKIVAELKSSHDAIYRERISRITSEKERVESRLRAIGRLNKKQDRQGLSSAPKFTGEILSARGPEMEMSAHLLEAYRHVLEERLDRSLSYPTDLFLPVDAPRAPIAPNWVMLGIYSLLSGVLATLAVLAVSLNWFSGYGFKGEEN